MLIFWKYWKRTLYLWMSNVERVLNREILNRREKEILHIQYFLCGKSSSVTNKKRERKIEREKKKYYLNISFYLLLLNERVWITLNVWDINIFLNKSKNYIYILDSLQDICNIFLLDWPEYYAPDHLEGDLLRENS